MTTSGASAVTTTGSHCQLTDSRCWICGVFILCILSFYSSEMDNVSSANGKQQMALRAVVGFWPALARVESKPCTARHRAATRVKHRRWHREEAALALANNLDMKWGRVESGLLWKWQSKGSASHNSFSFFLLFFISFFSFQTVSRSSSHEGPWV